MKPIKISERAYEELLLVLKRDYPPSVLYISWKRESVLGLSFRHHTIWELYSSETVVYLDFYDELKQTFFLIKYGEYLK